MKTEYSKIKNKEKKIPQLAEYALTVNKNSPKEYINLSGSVESAAVAQLAEHLPDEQESSQTSGFELFHENPGRGAYTTSILNVALKENG